MIDAIRIMRQREAGLLNFWTKMYVPEVRQCLHNGRQHTKDTELVKPLDLKSLIGTFIILIFGWALSLLVFVGDRIMGRFQKTQTAVSASPDQSHIFVTC